ncbi:MAG: CoB--CoM heterodisulfide reductase iron-sulfur subunit B family protein [Thermodesulfobacteriota bacterium]
MSDGFRVAYFPGCTLKTDARDFESSALAVAGALGIEAAELSRWNCCGTVYSLDAVNLIPRLASVHNLIRAEEEGFSEMMTLCSMCYNTLKRTNNLFTSKNTGLSAINDFLCLKPGYNGRIKIYHFLEFLREKIRPEQVKDLVTSPLEGLAVAPYYGCLLLRPREIAIDDPEKPEILTPFLSALGAKVINFPLNNECCGAYQTAVHQEAVARRACRIIGSAQSEGADMIAASCPLCHYNLSALQNALTSRQSGPKAMPIVYFTELMAQAMGLNYKAGVEAISQDAAPGREAVK